MLRTLLLGVLVYAPLYGLSFEILQRADIFYGIVLGTAHGLVAMLIATVRRRNSAHPARTRGAALLEAARVVAARVLYGAVLGFVYLVPNRIA
jgi:hypothetical protein